MGSLLDRPSIWANSPSNVTLAGEIKSTRCIGCYIAKAGYKDSSYLSGASSEPVLSTPEIVGPITINDSCRFLVLMSGGLCKTLQDIYSTNIVNREIIQIIVEQFRTQSTLTGVAQSAVHKVVQLHHDTYMRQVEDSKEKFTSRDDITLLVRNFNYPMPNAIHLQRNRNIVSIPCLRLCSELD